MDIPKNIKLANGVNIPLLGFGTFQIPEGKATYEAVTNALEAGYRHIDTAEFYGNENSVGEAVRASGINRSELFLTTKVWNNHHGYKEAFKAGEESLSRLKTDYIDLLLIHWPKDKNCETWRALEDLYKKGLVKAIGVSNFKERHIEEILRTLEIMPMVNQIELHPLLSQEGLSSYCREKGIVVEAWSPMMRGRVSEIPELNNLAEKYNKNAGQITLKWHMQKGRVILPRSTNPERIKGNSELFDFQLDDEEIAIIDRLNKGRRIGPDPDHIDF